MYILFMNKSSKCVSAYSLSERVWDYGTHKNLGAYELL